MSQLPRRRPARVVVFGIAVSVALACGVGYVTLTSQSETQSCAASKVIGPDDLTTKAERLAWYKQQYPDRPVSCNQRYIDYGNE